jgi:hypothetical protein
MSLKDYSNNEIDKLLRVYCVLENLEREILTRDSREVKCFLGLFESTLKEYYSFPKELKEFAGVPVKLNSKIIEEIIKS